MIPREILSEMTAWQQPVIVMKTIPVKILKLLLEFVYKGSVQMRENVIEQFLEAGRHLEIEGVANNNEDVELVDDDESDIEEVTPARRRIFNSTSSSDQCEQLRDADQFSNFNPDISEIRQAVDTSLTRELSVNIRRLSKHDSRVAAALEDINVTQDLGRRSSRLSNSTINYCEDDDIIPSRSLDKSRSSKSNNVSKRRQSTDVEELVVLDEDDLDDQYISMRDNSRATSSRRHSASLSRSRRSSSFAANKSKSRRSEESSHSRRSEESSHSRRSKESSYSRRSEESSHSRRSGESSYSRRSGENPREDCVECDESIAVSEMSNHVRTFHRRRSRHSDSSSETVPTQEKSFTNLGSLYRTKPMESSRSIMAKSASSRSRLFGVTSQKTMTTTTVPTATSSVPTAAAVVNPPEAVVNRVEMMRTLESGAVEMMMTAEDHETPAMISETPTTETVNNDDNNIEAIVDQDVDMQPDNDNVAQAENVPEEHSFEGQDIDQVVDPAVKQVEARQEQETQDDHFNETKFVEATLDVDVASNIITIGNRKVCKICGLQVKNYFALKSKIFTKS